jgi:hypothetical protein
MEEKSHTLALKRRLWILLPKQHSHSEAQFWASSGALGESRERAEKRATRWLCWQSDANPSLPAKVGNAG